MNWRLFFDRLRGIQPTILQPPAKEITMTTFADIKTKVEAELVLAEDSLKADWARLVAWLENKAATDAATIAAEIAHLQGMGYTVTPPVPPVV